MPRKYINIKQVYAKSPFLHSQLHFIIKRRERQALPSAQLDLGNKILNIAPNEYLQFEYSSEVRDELGLYLIVVSTDNRVVSIGHIPLYLGEQLQEKKQYLKGVAMQNGFVIYSTKDSRFSAQDHSYAARPMQNNWSFEQGGRSVADQFKNHANQQIESKIQQNGWVEVQKQSSSSIGSKSIGQLKCETQKKGCQSQISYQNIQSQVFNPSDSNIRSEGNDGQRGEQQKSSKVGCSGQKYRKAKEKLRVYKQQNDSYKDELSELQLEFRRQEEKLKLLGLVRPK